MTTLKEVIAMFRKISVAIAASVWVFGMGAAARGADTYQVDGVHSSLIFRVKHFDVSYLYGRINGASGALVIDESDPSKSSFTASAEVKNIDTNNGQRDTHLKGPDFFNGKEFPTISFKSTAVK